MEFRGRVERRNTRAPRSCVCSEASGPGSSLPAAQAVLGNDSGEKDSRGGGGSDVWVGKALPWGLQFVNPGGQGTKVTPQKSELRMRRGQENIYKGGNQNF